MQKSPARPDHEIFTTEHQQMFHLAFVAGRNEWTDETTPRTDRPVRFIPAHIAPYGVRWELRGRYAVVRPSRIA